MRKSHSVSALAIAASLLMTATPSLAEKAKTQATAGAESLATNPLLADWNTPEGVPPYDLIKPEHYEPAFDAAIAQTQKEIRALTVVRSRPTFENTIEALEKTGALLNRIAATFYTVASSDATAEIQKVEEAVTPKLAALESEIYLDQALFNRVDRVFKDRAQFQLTPEQSRVLEITHQRFVRAGAQLPEAGRQRLAKLDQELAALSFNFNKSVLAAQKAGDLFLSEAEMAGMPEGFKASAAAKAKAAGKDGQYLISATRSDFEPFLTLATNRAAREKVFKAFDERGNVAGDTNTNAAIRDITALRLERAKLLGYETYADFSLDSSMAQTPEAAMKLLKQVYEAALTRAKAEEADLLVLAQKDKLSEIKPWDWRFYSEKVRAERYAIDESVLQTYLPLEGIINALIESNERLYGVKLVERKDIPVWKPDVRTFDVMEGDKRIGLFYADWFARDTKRPGAWMNEIRTQNGLTGDTPQVVNNMNITPPAAGQVALVSFDDAETVFHEFGHGLHGLLSTTRYPSLAGTNVYRDFVEFPSQVYEHWISDRGLLERHAKNAKGEAMPSALLDSFLKARTFNQGYLTVQQLASALVDMELHLLKEIPADFDVQAFEKATLAKYGVPESVGMRHRLTHFTHLFGGGYAASYYAYTWAEVLEADAFSMWEESGDIWNREITDRYRAEVLSKGNSRPPLESYIKFRGREPNAGALLRYRGLN